MSSGTFISFEGIDGAGKSTHIARVADLFRQAGRAVVLTREPGGTPLSEKLRELVLHEAMDPLTEALLMFAARREHLVQVIEPALARGDVVLCDRFTDATFAYQGGGRGFDWQVLAQLERMVQQRPVDDATTAQAGHTPEASHTPHARHAREGEYPYLWQPDLTVWFDLDPLIAAERLASARVPDKFESQPAEFFAAVRAGYAKRQAEMPGRFARIDAAQSMEAVGADVSRIVNDWLQRSAA
ncbi:dTMP kinase [Limnohabitans sp. Hippo3]|uniref:dTMP kinase n=1 Tax=Limnohabitans sp. Hippo3 TaxID=1597956 RepID=UPI000D358D35|nr:dTMP kinase [Limnohabitans sp. Hippo3]PUE43535.1 dTMP kinase [Limnohabitans sp. Hippo3]